MSTKAHSKVVAALFAFFMGWLGIHKFYLGQVGMGVLYLLISLFSFVLFFFPIIIIGIISFIEGIIYLSMSEENFDKKYNY
jgi:TM2 domain-containing membrane protein YozV